MEVSSSELARIVSAVIREDFMPVIESTVVERIAGRVLEAARAEASVTARMTALEVARGEARIAVVEMLAVEVNVKLKEATDGG